MDDKEVDLILNDILLEVKPVKLRKSIAYRVIGLLDGKNLEIKRLNAYIKHKCNDVALLNKALELICYDEARSFNPNGNWEDIKVKTMLSYKKQAEEMLQVCK